MESLEIDSDVYVQLIFDKNLKIIQWTEKFFQQAGLEQWTSTY